MSAEHTERLEHGIATTVHEIDTLRAERDELRHKLALALPTIDGYEDVVQALAKKISKDAATLDCIRGYAQSLRGYAQSLRALSEVTRAAGGDYLAHTYDETATALDRLIGDQP